MNQNIGQYSVLARVGEAQRRDDRLILHELNRSPAPVWNRRRHRARLARRARLFRWVVLPALAIGSFIAGYCGWLP